MKDIQSQEDSRCIDIRKVGVKNISYPISVLDKARQVQRTVATVNMYVNLPHQFKGTHMSRFVEILNRHHCGFTLKSMHLVLQEMKDRLNAQAAHLEMNFPYYFQASRSPFSFKSQRYDCLVHSTLRQKMEMVVRVKVPVAFCLPGSMTKEMLEGRWGTALVSVRLHHFVWLEELIELIEHSLLPDDTVERLCRKISDCLKKRQAFSWYKVVVEHVSKGYQTSAAIEGP
ncbi:MAG: hypothetical protein CSA31_00830 [Desulfobulbus propionicus]|nr:MAG: hypothetical protein CSA31_00830 [Desulfobulbus propionicus]